MDNTTCFLCGTKTEGSSRDFDHDTYSVPCPRCGKYRITRQCSRNPQSTDERTLRAISAATRQADDSGSPLLLRIDNWDQLAATHTNTPVRQKVLKVLRYAAGKSTFPGELFQ